MPYEFIDDKPKGRYQFVDAEPSTMDSIRQGAGNVLAGLTRGAGSIGATLLAPKDMLMDAIDGKGLSLASNRQRRADMDAALSNMGAETDSFGYGAGKLVGEIAGTAGAGGVVANAARAVPFLARTAAPVIEAIGSSGMTAGGLTGKAAFGARALGSGIAGGAQAAMVDPNDALMGAGIGAVTPGALQLAGKFGSTVYNAVKGGKPGAGKMLANAMGVTEDELPAIIAALNAAPESIVDGSKLTVNQALQKQGMNVPGAKLLERTAAGGVGGESLLKRYADQAAARRSALETQGALFDVSAREEANNVGNRIGATLRTQAADDSLAARVAWKGEDGIGGVYGRALQDGVSLNLPLDAMQGAMSPLGRGSVIAGTDARRVLGVANDIGTMELPSVAPLTQKAAKRIPVPVPFAEFQRLRRDSGELGARLADKGSATEAGVLNDFNRLLTQRADDAANGLTMTGDNVSPQFLAQYNAARSLTKRNAEAYKGGNNIASILRKPSGQDYTLGGDEITNKLWHGGSGLADDVANLKNVLSSNNYQPTMDKLRRFIMTDAASKTTASGDLASQFPRYVETRMPGLLEAMEPTQLRTLENVAADIRNQDAANNVKGLLGSDTEAKVSRALDAGLLGGDTAKRIGGLLSMKGFGAESLREAAANSIVKYKGRTISELMTNPKDAAKALSDSNFVESLDNETLKALRLSLSRSSPLLVSD